MEFCSLVSKLFENLHIRETVFLRESSGNQQTMDVSRLNYTSSPTRMYSVSFCYDICRDLVASCQENGFQLFQFRSRSV